MYLDKNQLPIGIFDSGVGGISVLKEAIKDLPNEDFIYYGDNGNAPYGNKDQSEIKELTLHVADFLIDKGIKALVVACNTATSAAINDLRKKYNIPVIGIEPALKPAFEMQKNGKIVVMATNATLRQHKFKNLLAKYDKNNSVVSMPCPGLVEIIERGFIDGKELNDLLDKLYCNIDINDIDVVVLGCTHYIFIKETLKKYFGKDNIKIIDGNYGTVMQLKRILLKNKLQKSIEFSGKRKIEYYTSGNEKLFCALYKKFINNCD